jgi:anti-anti-sigma factor
VIFTAGEGGGGAESELRATAIDVELRTGVAVISLIGEHDLATAEELRSTIERHCGGDLGVVVSLAATDFVDSAIVHGLFVGDRRLLAQGRRLVLHTGGDANVEALLTTAGVFDQLMWSDSLDEAVTFAAQQSDEPRTPR